MSTDTSANPQSLLLDIEQATREAHTALSLTVRNTGSMPVEHWALHLDLPRPVTAGSDTRLLSRVGSHLRLAPAEPTALQAGGQCRLQLLGDLPLLQRLSDLPSGLYLEAAGQCHPVTLASHNLPAPANAPPPGAPPGDPACPLIPAPTHRLNKAGVFHWPVSSIWLLEPQAQQAIAWLQAQLGCDWPGTSGDSSTSLHTRVDPNLSSEQYRLQITPQRLLLCASDSEGFMRGAATLLQLATTDHEGSRALPCVEIHDEPRFRYRGLMLDCARHFHNVDTILQVLDWMALYKLNHFHWHLTDDEAWRLEIQAFPALTEIGAWRGEREVLPPQLGSGPERYGGYYSREDVSTVVTAAAQRGISVIPEIDIPGHCRAAIQALPDLLQEPEDQSTYLSVQFFDDNVLNPGLPGTYQFLETVLEEVCDMFPGPYVHMGADEVPEGVWAGSPSCRALMAREQYAEPMALQGHLLRHVQAFLGERGRLLVGWEEAARGGKLDHTAPICAWSGDRAVDATADLGYPVISCPAPWAYLDLAWSDSPGEPGLYWAGTADLQSCYQHPPCQAGREAALLGVQANLWSELITSPEKLQYMLFPRLFATAQWGWSASSGEDWQDFNARSRHQLGWLDARGVRGRPLEGND